MLRVGIDSAVESDGRSVADDLAGLLAEQGSSTTRVSGRHFWRARSLRLEWGYDADAVRRLQVDLEALRRCVLDPLGPGGDRVVVDGLRDPLTDRSLRRPARQLPVGGVLVLDGRFLAREPARSGLDLLVHLVVGGDAVRRRVAEDELPEDPDVVAQAWADYRRQDGPDQAGAVLVRFEHPDRPAILRLSPRG